MLAQLEAKLALLRSENARLRDELAPPGTLPAVFDLTPKEERAFKALLWRDQWTKESLLASVYLDTPEHQVPEIKIIDVIVCKLRAKLRPFGLDVETFWNKGYRISPAMRARAGLIIEREQASSQAHSRPAAGKPAPSMAIA